MSEVFLTELYEIRSGLSKPAKDFGTGYPFLAFKDVFYNFFVPESLSELVQSSEMERKNCSVRRGDVFLTRTSETMHELGMSCVALKDYEHATFNGFTKRLRPKAGTDIIPEYVGYYLRSPKFRNGMMAFSTMSTRASLNNEMIGRLKLVIPSIAEQKAIAHILGSLDDRIELNRRMNETLEAMAQALFKSWFVDFDPVIDNALAGGKEIPEELSEKAQARAALGDKRRPLPKEIRTLFPDKFTYSDELGWIPKGWENSPLGDEIDFATGPAFKSKDFSEQGVRLARGMNVKEGQFQWGENTRYWPEISQDLKKYELKSGDVLIGMDGSKIGKNWVRVSSSDLPCLLVQRVARLRPINTVGSTLLEVLIGGEMFKRYVENVKTGTSIPHISGGQIKNYPIVNPCDNGRLFRKFESLFDAAAKKREENLTQTNLLTQLRDTLLPKLLSGELRIPDAEKMVEELAL